METLLYLPASVGFTDCAFGLLPTAPYTCVGDRPVGEVAIRDLDETPYFPETPIPCVRGRLRWEAVCPDPAVLLAEAGRATPHRCLLRIGEARVAFDLWPAGFVFGTCAAIEKRDRHIAAQAVARLFGASPAAGFAPGATTPRAVYEALLGRGLAYDDTETERRPEGLPRHLQALRAPGQVLADGRGNCLSFSVLIALELEARGLDPVLLTVPGHAFVGVLAPDAGEVGELLPRAALLRLLRDGHFIAFEATAIASGQSWRTAQYTAETPYFADAAHDVLGFRLRGLRRRFGLPAGLGAEAFSGARASTLRVLSAAIAEAAENADWPLADTLLAQAPRLLGNPLAVALAGGESALPRPDAPVVPRVPFLATPEQEAIVRAFAERPLVVADACPGSGKSLIAATLAAACAPAAGPVALLAGGESQRDRLRKALPEAFRPYACAPFLDGDDLRPWLRAIRDLLTPEPLRANAVRAATDGRAAPAALASGYLGRPVAVAESL